MTDARELVVPVARAIVRTDHGFDVGEREVAVGKESAQIRQTPCPFERNQRGWVHPTKSVARPPPVLSTITKGSLSLRSRTLRHIF
ncbi:hypothetical protein KM043_000449 [Ampulex compressa]|nr:hypothetical protein KM043_000449 [Ampulex compressa]